MGKFGKAFEPYREMTVEELFPLAAAHPETLHRGLRAMMLTRAYDNRMFRAQRQGKTSFYMVRRDCSRSHLRCALRRALREHGRAEMLCRFRRSER